jgi:DNA alkylation repair enzyme
MNVSALVAEIEARVERMPGRNVQLLRALRREYSKRTTAVSPANVIKIAAALISRQRMHRFIGDELISSRPDALRLLDRTQLEDLGSSISSWDEVDSFACYLSGPAWRERQVDDKTIMAWARSGDRWWRRAALVSTVPLNVKSRGGHGDTRRTLRICSLLVADRDELVAKAMSWALRALAKHDAEAVREFVKKNQSRLPALVRREVRHKLETGRKGPRRDH